MVRTRRFHCWGLGSIPCQGTKIPEATRGQKKKKEKTQMNLSTKQKQSHRHRKQTCGCGRGREGLGVWGQQKQTIIHRTDKQQGPTAEHSALYTISCDKPVTEKKIKKNVYTCMTEPLCCTAETTTTL